MKVGIAIDPWKLPIFERRLSQAGYKYEVAGDPAGAFLTISVETTNPMALGNVVEAANLEARKTGKGK